MTEPLVSVVTPFYNTAEFLGECVESVLAQDYPEFEYILQDNCSTDGSGEVAARFAQMDGRIRFRRNEDHLGQTENYNEALRFCSPEAKYVKIVQADDWLYPNCLTEMVSAAEENPQCRLVLAHYHRGMEIGGTPLSPDRTSFPGRQLARMQLQYEAFFFGTPTTVLYLGEDVRSRHDFYRTDRFFEDTDLGYEIAKDHEIAFVHQILTGVRVGNPSIMTGASPFNPYILDKLIQVESYGRDFLTPEEFGRLQRDVRREYYGALAPRVLRGAEPGFWEYHQEGLRTVGLEISRWALGLATVRYLLDQIACPRDAIRRLANRFRKPPPTP